MSVQIVHAYNNQQLDSVRDLVRSFIRWHRERHIEDTVFTDKYFDAAAIEKELEALPGKYAPPIGSLLLALYNDEPAGCVALRQIDEHTCEMKRMFIYTRFHGKGIGRALAIKIIEEAKTIGYSSMKLDTSIRQIEAQTLYESLGFKRIAPYYDLPEKLKEWLVFMELELK